MERWLFRESAEHYEHPLIRPGSIEYRLYQVRLAREALKGNTLIVLPTGLGKTVIAAIVAAHRLHEESWGKVVMLTPTRPLAQQHAETFRQLLNLNPSEIVVLTGTTPPEKRAEQWKRARIIVMTPQTLKNDLIAGRYNLEDVVLLIFDEAHRAVGDYPYVHIAERYVQEAKDPLILAITASPGSDVEKLKEIIKNLKIERIEARDETSPDVRPYIHPVKIEWRFVEMGGEYEEAASIIRELLKKYLEEFKEKGYVTSANVRRARLRELLEAKAIIQERLKEQAPPPKELLEDLAKVNMAARLLHMMELLETQGFHALYEYLRKLEAKAGRRGASKELKNFVASADFHRLLRIAEKMRDEPHPKVKALLDIIRREGASASRIIVFTNYRSTAELLTQRLREAGLKAAKFVGQARRSETDPGMSQKEQERVLREFKQGIYRILVATQVAEEGLDIAECDMVIFYDNVPSAIRFVQRKGRTGRRRAGRVIVLIAKGTRDEAYYWSAIHKRRLMREAIRKLSQLLRDLSEGKQQRLLPAGEQAGAETMVAPGEPKVEVLVDHRELNTKVADYLVKLGARIKPIMMVVADYVVSDEVAIERKRIDDFVKSIIDRRIFKQAEALKRSYRKPVIIVEGRKLTTGIRPEAIFGAIASLIVDFGIPVILTENEAETAKYIVALARREQLERRRAPRLHAGVKPVDMSDIQLEILSAIPGIDRVLADRLLRHFRTIEKVFTASTRELMEVEGIGPKLAETLRRVATTPYEPRTRPEGSRAG